MSESEYHERQRVAKLRRLMREPARCAHPLKRSTRDWTDYTAWLLLTVLTACGVAAVVLVVALLWG